MIAEIDVTQLQREEGSYEMRVVSHCIGNVSTPGDAIVGRIDRVAPKLFGAFQEPADRIYWPGTNLGRCLYSQDSLISQHFLS